MIDSIGAAYADAGAVYLYRAKDVTARYDPRTDTIEGDSTSEYEIWIRRSSSLEDYSRIYVSDDPRTSLEGVEVEILDLAGEKVRDFDKGDLTWNSWVDRGGGVTTLDRKLSMASIPGLATGQRLRVRLRYRFSGYHGMPNFSLGGHEVPCVRDAVHIRVPEEVEFVWEAVGPAHLTGAMAQEVGEAVGEKTYSWTIEDVPVLGRTRDTDVDALRLNLVTHMIVTGDAAGAGSFAAGKSWADAAVSYRDLIADRLVVTPEIEELAHRLAPASATHVQKIDLLYAHVQQTTRYTGIYEGLEGIIPESASMVMDKKFGDCKGLGVYLIALLRAVDIEAWPVLVRTDHLGALAESTPNPNQFNHFIVWAADGADGIWLDATLEECPVGAIYPQDAASPVLTMRPGHEGLVEIPYEAWHPGEISYHLVGEIDFENRLVLTADMEASGVTGIRLRSRRLGMTEKQGRNLRKSVLLPESLPMREGEGSFDSGEDWARPVHWSLASRGTKKLPGTRTDLFLPATLVSIPVPREKNDPLERPDRRESWAIALPVGMEAVPDTMVVSRAGLTWKRMVWQEGDTLRLAREIRWDRQNGTEVSATDRFQAEKEAFAAEKTFITLKKGSNP